MRGDGAYRGLWAGPICHDVAAGCAGNAIAASRDAGG